MEMKLLKQEVRIEFDAQDAAPKRGRSRAGRKGRRAVENLRFVLVPRVEASLRAAVAKNGGERLAPRVEKSFDAEFPTDSVFRVNRRQERRKTRRADRSLLGEMRLAERVGRDRKGVVRARFLALADARARSACGRSSFLHYTIA